jgi:hypothetical protein
MKAALSKGLSRLSIRMRTRDAQQRQASKDDQSYSPGIDDGLSSYKGQKRKLSKFSGRVTSFVDDGRPDNPVVFAFMQQIRALGPDYEVYAAALDKSIKLSLDGAYFAMLKEMSRSGNQEAPARFMYESEAEYQVAKEAFDKSFNLRTQAKRKQNTIRKLFFKVQIAELVPPPAVILQWIGEGTEVVVIPSRENGMTALEWLKPALLCAHRDPTLKKYTVDLLSSAHFTRNLEHMKIFTDLRAYAVEQGASIGKQKMNDYYDKEDLGSSLGKREFRLHGGREWKTQEDCVLPDGAAESSSASARAGVATDSSTPKTDPPDHHPVQATDTTEKEADVATPEGKLAAGSGVSAVRLRSMSAGAGTVVKAVDFESEGVYIHLLRMVALAIDFDFQNLVKGLAEKNGGAHQGVPIKGATRMWANLHNRNGHRFLTKELIEAGNTRRSGQNVDVVRNSATFADVKTLDVFLEGMHEAFDGVAGASNMFAYDKKRAEQALYVPSSLPSSSALLPPFPSSALPPFRLLPPFFRPSLHPPFLPSVFFRPSLHPPFLPSVFFCPSLHPPFLHPPFPSSALPFIYPSLHLPFLHLVSSSFLSLLNSVLPSFLYICLPSFVPLHLPSFLYIFPPSFLHLSFFLQDTSGRSR